MGFWCIGVCEDDAGTRGGCAGGSKIISSSFAAALQESGFSLLLLPTGSTGDKGTERVPPSDREDELCEVDVFF